MQAAARRRGRRGSRGSRRSWRRRVRLLSRAAPVFAANGSPTAAPLLLLPSFTPFSSGGSVWVVRGTPLGRLGLGEPWGSRRRLLIAAGGAGVRGQSGCAGGTRGAPRRRGHGRRATLWPLAVSQRGKDGG
jgi:hypothetical protein